MKKFIFISLLLISCSSNISVNISEPIINKEYSYDDVSTMIEFEDIFNQIEEDYLIYFFSTTCGHCEALKQEIISFYSLNIITIYFVDCTNKDVYGNKKDLTGVFSLEEFYIFGTPFLINIISGVINNYYYGVSQIKEYISSKISINQIE